MSPETTPDERRVQLFTPTGKDGAPIARVLARADFTVQTCADADELCSEIQAGAAAVVIAEEGLGGDSLNRLAE